MPIGGGGSPIGTAKAGIEEFTLSATSTGGTTYTQALSVGQAGSPSLRKGALLARPLAQGAGAGLRKAGTKSLLASGASAAGAAASRLRAVVLAATCGGTGLYARAVGKGLTVSPAPVGGMRKGASKSVGVTQAAFAWLWAGRVKTVFLTVTCGGGAALQRVTNKSLAGAQNADVNCGKFVGKMVAAAPGLNVSVYTGNLHTILLAVTSAASGLYTLQTQKLLAMGQNAPANATRSIGKVIGLLAASAPVCSVGRLYFAGMAAIQASGAGMRRQAGKRVGAMASNATHGGKAISKRLRAQNASLCRQSASLLYLRGLAVGQASGASMQRLAGKALAVGQGGATNLIRLCGKGLGVIAGSASLARNSKTARVALTVGQSVLGGCGKFVAHTLNAVNGAGLVGMTKQAGKLLAWSLAAPIGFARVYGKALTVGEASAVALTRGVWKLLATPGANAIRAAKLIPLRIAAGSASATGLRNAVGKAISVVVAATIVQRAGRLFRLALAVTTSSAAKLLHLAKTRLVLVRTGIGKRG